MKACYASEMRAIDRAATEVGSVPSIILMENAALACENALKTDFPDLKSKRIAVFCGKGNNGGDGFALARRLYFLGADVSVYLVCGNDFGGDAKINFDIIKKTDISIDTLSDTDSLSYIIRAADIVVDAIFGTGIHGAVTGLAADVIREINDNSRYTLSVDVPSGINSDSGEICGICVKADKTVTFAAYKIGMLLFPAADFVGDVTVADISIPEYIIEQANISVNVTDEKTVRSVLVPRARNTQKGDYGKVLVIAGSVGMSGAAYLASAAAIDSGSGLVTLAVPKSLNAAMEAKTTEVMTYPLPETDGHISAAALDRIYALMDRADAVLIGCGMGVSADTSEILRGVLSYSRVPVIVDADAINAAAKNKDILDDCTCPVIFTPHTVEMERLTGLSREYIENNRLEVSREFAEEYGVTVILKGHHTIVTAPRGEQYINITGNPGLATGGSGDVLAGITASLAARCADETAAAAAAVYIHGTAGDVAKKRFGEESVTASRVLDALPEALSQILQVEK